MERSAWCGQEHPRAPLVRQTRPLDIFLLFSDIFRVTSLIARASGNVAAQPAPKAEAKGLCGAGAAFGRLKRRPGAIRKPFPQTAGRYCRQAGLSHSLGVVCPSCSEQEVKVQQCLLSITVHINRHRKIKSWCSAQLPLDVLINILASCSV